MVGKALTAANLQALGAERLAALLMEISRGSAPAQRHLRLALAGTGGPEATARAVSKRLASIGQARTWLDWRKIKPLAAELDAQRRTVLDAVAPADPREAFELMWRLVSCAETVLARTDDVGGLLSEAFGAAARELGPLAAGARVTPDELAGRAARALSSDQPGAWTDLVPILAPSLGPDGLHLLRESLAAWRTESPRSRSGGAVLRQVADALGDVDGFAATYEPLARRRPGVAAAIARRLLDAGRATEAWTAIEQADGHEAPIEWEQVRLDALEALGRPGEAQAFRWRCFAATLNGLHLRAFLRALPDFDDVEAEERAMAHALQFPDAAAALAFLVGWPDLRTANQLVLTRGRHLNGGDYERLSPAADALDSRYPLAATLLRRAMIEWTLRASRASRYKHAARHLRECRAGATRVEAFNGVPDHDAFERALRAAHGRKAGFWQAAD